MQIQRILLRNLHSIRSEVEIDFMASPLVEAGLFAITGDTGAGKTTILDAITLAMYGKVCRNSKPEEVLSHGAEEGFSECDFEANGRRIRCQWRCWVPRSKKENPLPKTERSVAEWDEGKKDFLVVAERKIREVDAFVEEVSGLDFERFTRSAMLAQGEFAAFLKAAPRERSELLERITGTEIYSELGIAAHERHNLEKAKLAELVAKREALQVFSKEEIKERKAELKEKELAAKSTRNDLDTSKNALQWLQTVEQLQQRNQSALANLSAVELEKTKIQDSEAQLAKHRKTMPFHPTLVRLEDKLNEVKTLKDATVLFAQKIATQQAEQELAKKNLDEKTAELSLLKSNQGAAMRLFDEVGKMDTRLETLNESIQKTTDDLQAVGLEKEKAATQIAEQTNQETEHSKALTELDKWLKTNVVWAELPQDLPAITIHEQTLREILIAEKSQTEEAKSYRQKSEKAAEEVQQIASKLKQDKAALADLVGVFEKTAPKNFAPNRPDLLEKLTKEIDSLGERHKSLAKLGELNSEYRVALSEHAKLVEKLEELKREELWLDKALLTAYEESEELEQQLVYRREVYNQQLLLANYEKDRANLKEGDPCPLCLSTHHPFRFHEVKPFVDETRNDLNAVEKIQAERQRHRTQLLKKHIEINAQIQQIDGQDAGDLRKQETKIIELEQRLAAFLPGLDGEDFSRSHGEWLVSKLDNFETELAEKKVVREKLAQLNNQISVQEDRVRTLESQLKEVQFTQQQSERSLLEREATLKELTQKFKEATVRLNQLVGKYGYQFSLETAKKMFADLKEKENEYSDKKTKRDNHERQLELTKQSLKQWKATNLDLEQKIGKLGSELSRLQSEFDVLKANRMAVFGEKNVIAEREKLMSELDAVEKSMTTAQSQHTQANEQLTLTQHRLESSQALLTSNEKVVEELEASLKTGLSKAGFESLEALRSAHLPIEEAERLEALVEKLKLREAEARQEAKSAKTALEEVLAKPLTQASVQETEENVSRLEAELQTLQQAIGALNQQLKDNENRKAAGEAILQQIDHQRLEYNRWAAVHDLIGSHDGSKFRKFAQGLTLQKLVQLANIHLENLYGRYFVLKRPGDDLELDIVDTYQADNIRSMMTLSGGESFLVSLSLALGLSDLAGRNANIRSLFIDEGFGTLDEQTLDLAISTLENLQAKGKTIGIISHVKELKERITTQIRVVKKGGGTSVVEVV